MLKSVVESTKYPCKFKHLTFKIHLTILSQVTTGPDSQNVDSSYRMYIRVTRGGRVKGGRDKRVRTIRQKRYKVRKSRKIISYNVLYYKGQFGSTNE